MDFKDSPEDAAFRRELREWLDDNAEPKTGEESEDRLFTDSADEQATVDREKAWQKKLYDAGWGVITWPKEYGGRDATAIQAFIFREEMRRYDVPQPGGLYLVGHGMVGPTIISHGTPEQKARLIPPMAEGSEVWCQLWSEPGAGSDLAGLSTRAERDGAEGDWILNGQKVWTTGAQLSKWGLIVARTEPDLPKHQGITCFVVDVEAPGVEVRPLRQMTGGADFNEVFFTDVRIPSDMVIGEVNDGWRVAMTTLMNERYAVGIGGSGEAMVVPLIRLAMKIEQNGGRAFDDPVVRQGVADAWIRGKLLSLTGYRSLTKISKGGIPGPEGSVMKLVRTLLVSDVAEFGTEVLGPAGILWAADAPADGVWSSNYVGAIGARIGGGTDEIMKNIIGERVLGLPKEPDPLKGLTFRELQQHAGK